jgi:hypothetical protein
VTKDYSIHAMFARPSPGEGGLLLLLFYQFRGNGFFSVIDLKEIYAGLQAGDIYMLPA